MPRWPARAFADRFWARVARDGDGCWAWTGARDADGYGVVRGPRGEWWRAHRVAYVLGRGQALPAGLYVLHSCDRPSCCNPAHLSTGNPAENLRDQYERGRRLTRLRSPGPLTL